MTKGIKYAAISASFILVGAGASAVAAGAAVPSDSAKSTASAKTSARAMSDSDFAKAAAEGGAAEIKLGQLAEDKGSNQTVKDFGKRMVADHTQADQKLATAASKDNLSTTIPAELNAKDQATYDRLFKLSGSAFDRAYARDMVRDHVNDVAAFRHESNNGKDADIRSFASSTLPTLESHLKQAREMLHTVSPTANSSTKS